MAIAENPKDYFDIGVVIPLEEELIEFMNVFPSTEDHSTDTVLCHVVDSGNDAIKIVVVQQQGMGKTHAVNAANFLLDRYEIGLMVCLGIAGSLSDDMSLASVCYSGKISDVLDNNKITDLEEDASDTEFSPTHYDTPDKFTQAFGFMRTQPHLRQTYLDWQESRRAAAEELVTNEVPAPGGKLERIGAPTTKNGVIVCGMVSKSEAYNKKLRQIDRALLAIETESGGVFAQAKYHGDCPAMAIRGISDYADKDKKKLEHTSKGAVRSLAAANATSFFQLQVLKNPHFEKALQERRSGASQQPLQLNPETTPTDIVLESLNLISVEIDQALRRLSPEYKLQEKGYRLPLPRVQHAVTDEGVDDVNVSPVEVRDAIVTHDRIIVNIPRTYPDKSLPWVIAGDLLTAELDDRQAVPVVIDGEGIRGKKTTFANVATADIISLKDHEGARLVFIIENVPFTSKHRLDQIVDQINEFPDAKCIFVSRGNDALLEETDFSTRSAAEHYNTCSISFLEIAHFIEKNFGMTGNESEVVAKRLRDTFDRFDLDAHPSYFAGIPKETLAALLQANRRSELIQLAVDGFLTFIVAGDKSDVALRRTTRARFLKMFALQVHLEKQNFSQADLISFTNEFARKYDFDIDPLGFIDGFVKQGIMHFENGIARVSLPFIEAYLLASELADNPDAAEKYFVIDGDFDFSTFDLYAEIGASNAIVSRVKTALQEATDVLRQKNKTENVLLDDEFLPTAAKQRETTVRLKQRLTEATKAVQDGARNAEQKQQVIDLSERVRERARREFQSQSDDENEALRLHTESLSQASLCWTISTILLGSGAEHLEADDKRSLAAYIVSGAAAIVDDWCRLQLEFDFEEMKKALTSDEALADFPSDVEIAEKRKIVSGLVDMIEYAAMSVPLRRTLQFLSEQARHRVLSPSVHNAETSGILEALIKNSWLIDIDVERGRKPLSEAMKQLPQATFLRLTMVSHYMARVYWSHWKRDDRLALLDVAQEMLKPLSLDIDKGKMKRLVLAAGDDREQDS